MTKKDLAYVLFAALLLSPGVFYFISGHGFNKLLIKDLRVTQKLTAAIDPANMQNRRVVVKVNGISSGGYQLRVDSYMKDSANTSTSGNIHSRTISIPAGEVHGSFATYFKQKPGFDRVEISYIPLLPQAKGYVELKAGIF